MKYYRVRKKRYMDTNRVPDGTAVGKITDLSKPGNKPNILVLKDIDGNRHLYRDPIKFKGSSSSVSNNDSLRDNCSSDLLAYIRTINS